MRPTTKAIAWERNGTELSVMIDPRQLITLEDPGGAIERLLCLLRDDAPPLADVHRLLPQVTEADANSAIEALDGLGLLTDADRPALVERDLEQRYASNLGFFGTFTDLSRSSQDFQRALLEANVVMLGVGGVGSNTLMNLAGLGVGHITLLDCDEVEVSNLARQFVYTEADLGRSKVERAAAWVNSLNSSISVQPVNRRVRGPEDLTDLLAGCDLVVCAIDEPLEAARWVNQACVSAGVPWVRGGMLVSQCRYFSVDPGRSACFECLFAANQELQRDPGSAGIAARLTTHLLPLRHRIMGPIVALLGSLMAMEVLRYLTRFEEPAAAGAFHSIDVARGCAMETIAWERRPDCPVCSGAPGA